MILSAASIRANMLVEPCHPRSIVNGMSYGLGPAGYDVRVEFDPHGAVGFKRLESGGFLLASTIERFQMKPGIVGIVHDKSSWARKGLTVQNTVIEPGWHGYLTLELTNHSHETIVLRRGDPIAQIIFHLCEDASTEYSGKYQNQERGPQEAR